MSRRVDSLVLEPIADLPPAAAFGSADSAIAFAGAPARVECLTIAELRTREGAWADLCRRTLDPNIFLDPDFALPLLQHVAFRHRLSFLVVWDAGSQPAPRMLGLFPLSMPRGLGALARGFVHEQTSCGAPLVDRAQPEAVFEAVLTWLAGDPRRPAALALDKIAGDGALLAALQRFCAASSRKISVLTAWERAVLHRDAGTGGRVASFASAKRRKERARQLRRLSETGRRIYVSARTPAEIIVAAERFLALEDKGWKGSRGTSLLAAPARATFLRTMTRLMAEDGKCRIDAIEIDGQPVAMGIVLTQGDRAYYWKTTFNEAYASFSPGVQFTLELTRAQLADPGIAMTDSCAIAKHPMIDRLWPERMEVVNLVLSVRPGTDRAFGRAVRIEEWRLALRRRAKALWQATRRRKGD